jgi:hypothetical protein
MTMLVWFSGLEAFFPCRGVMFEYGHCGSLHASILRLNCETRKTSFYAPSVFVSQPTLFET